MCPAAGSRCTVLALVYARLEPDGADEADSVNDPFVVTALHPSFGISFLPLFC